MLNLDNSIKKEKLVAPLPFYEKTQQEVKFNMMLYISEYSNGMDIDCRYRKALFKPSKVTSLMEKYRELFDFFTSTPGKNINDYKRSGKRRFLKRK